MDQNNKKLSDVKFADYNPRTIDKHDFEALQKSMRGFGDLSCIVLNTRTGNLVGGHQRVRALLADPESTITITDRYPSPNSVGTTARGYVTQKGSSERFPYREVDWPIEREKSANIAANRIQGEWDLELLAQVSYELSQLEDKSLLELTGQTQAEINKLLQLSSSPEIDVPEGDRPGFQQVTFTLADEQVEVLNEALGAMRARHNFEGMPNENSNGNALYWVAQTCVDSVNAAAANEPS